MCHMKWVRSALSSEALLEGKGPPTHSCILLGPDVQCGGPCLSGFLGLMSAYEQLSLRSHGAPELIITKHPSNAPSTGLNFVFPQESPPTPYEVLEALGD
ncbi:unnamed protein product [Pipistrellus nathusii]|uniref:Uncharacterized protein n=1 Tax=Pipistrellus nathusii TaxID=59473 RepID=A0ABP0A6I9_PIPNA